MSYSQILGSVAPVFLIILCGFLFRRFRLLTAEADRSLMRLVVNLLYPCLIFDSILGNPAFRNKSNILLPPIVGFLLVASALLICWFIARRAALGDAKTERTFSYVAGIQNYGYLAIPIVIALFPRDVLGVLFTHNLGVEIAFWTIGVVILANTRVRDSWRYFLNAPILSIVAALLLNSLGVSSWLPKFSLTAIHMLGQSSIPLALILTGAILSDFFVNIRLTKVILFGVLCRLVLLPLLFLSVARILPCTAALKEVLIVQAAMPSSMFSLVITRHYKADTETAFQVILSTSLLGLFTIPFWIHIGLQWIEPALH